ncbi:hypothetical protein J7643_05275 [bacterium]|nr:hypothetical protein [bacterium]
MPSKKPGFSRRDLAWLMGFGFFVEAVLLYMLLIDPAMSRLAKIAPELARAQEAQATLQAALATSAPQPEAQALRLPAPILLASGESPSLAIQRSLDVQVAASGAQLLATTLDEATAAEGETFTRAKVRLAGSYEAIDAFVRRLATPDRLLTMEALIVRAVDPQADRLEAEVTLSYYFQAKEP